MKTVVRFNEANYISPQNFVQLQIFTSVVTIRWKQATEVK